MPDETATNLTRTQDATQAAGGAGAETTEPPAHTGTRTTKQGSKSRPPAHPLLELTAARLRAIWREPGVIFWSVVFPLLLAIALGIAFRNTGPQKVSVAVESQDAQTASGSVAFLAEALRRSNEVDTLVLSPAEAAQALRTGRVSLVVRPTGTPLSNAQAAPAGSFDYHFDPTRPESQQARLVTDHAIQKALGRSDVISARDVTTTEPGARYIDFLIPGLLGINLLGSGMWGVSLGIVGARMQKLLKRLAATPMRRYQYLLSFVLSRLIFLVVEVGVVLVFAWLLFGYRVYGSWLSMALLLLLGSVMFAGIGLLVAARPSTIEAVSGLMNLVMIPMWLLSGTFFSASRFPDFLQPVVKALPLTALNDSLRAVMNEGAPLASNWSQILIMLAWCAVTYVLAVRIFRWQ
jgi:ABC-type multidrug transport system permease subunit